MGQILINCPKSFWELLSFQTKVYFTWVNILFTRIGCVIEQWQYNPLSKSDFHIHSEKSSYQLKIPDSPGMLPNWAINS